MKNKEDFWDWLSSKDGRTPKQLKRDLLVCFGGIALFFCVVWVVAVTRGGETITTNADNVNKETKAKTVNPATLLNTADTLMIPMARKDAECTR